MVLIAVVLSILGQIDISGWVEMRPHLAWNDSANVYGYSRGWLEFRAEGSDYGSQVALDCIVPYDTIHAIDLEERVRISRLALWLGPEDLRIIAGKQRLYWGVARVFRPLDIFNPVNYFEPGYERPGSNAVLGYGSIGTMTSIRGVYVPQHDLHRPFWGFRLGTNVLKNDIGLNLMRKSSELRTTVGSELAGDLLVGYWSELSYTWEDTSQYAKTTLGIDYTFPGMIYGMLEFFWDGSGEDEPEDYDFAKVFSGERVTLARHYLYLSIGLAHNPFFRPSINSVVNLNDRGLVLIPQIYYSIFENAELTLGLNYFLGSSSCEFKTISPFDGQIYIWSRVYF